MKLGVLIPAVLALFAAGGISGWFLNGHYADRMCGSMLLNQINSDASQQFARFEKIKEILATGDDERLKMYLDSQIDMAKLAVKSSVVAAE